MDLNLRGKVAIVTGAGRGIGRAISLTFAEEGAWVVVNDIDSSVAGEVAQEVALRGSRALAVRADVTKGDEVETLVKRTVDEFKKVDILVNNAGILYDADGPLERKLFQESSPEEWHREIELILFGTLNCIQAVIGLMIGRRSGRIVNIASDLGRTNNRLKGVTTYSAGKGGVIALTRSIATEVAPYGITLNTVCPGFVRATRALLAEKQREARPKEYEYYKNMEKMMEGTIPLGRVGMPEDIARLTVFLASDAASWITGQTYSVNGGNVMI
jgi:NAD(P)-dependent dehydrogenase (short-subunit alcohol dehydrogenase family)